MSAHMYTYLVLRIPAVKYVEEYYMYQREAEEKLQNDKNVIDYRRIG